MSRMNEGTSVDQAGQGTQALSDVAGQVSQQLRDVGGQVRDAATQRYEQLRDQANDYYEQGRDRARQWEQGIEGFVQEKPLQALVMAAGVGVLLGLIWKRI